MVANRGEIARRVLATCRSRGLRTVAVHSSVDADAPHVHEADLAVALSGEPVAAYLDVDAIVAAAVDTGADAIHPGYGFLSENPALPHACEAAGVTFVGPSADVITLMGDKAAAKEVAADAGVPVLRSIDPAGLDDAALRQAVDELGLPVLVKAVSGGGGKGMRRVDDLDDLADAVAGAAREGAASFGDDRLLIERYVTAPRHVEIQVAGDVHGGAVHLFERDCSVQRRHQKVVEEAPSPALDATLREEMGAAAVALVERVGYVNLGTVEFILDTTGGGTDFFFLEMNTRLQVEHPVTELVTGLDLVGCQLDIADGGHVPERPDQPDGHAIEVRLYAEDAAAGHLPQTGRLDRFAIGGTDVRVDAGVEPGSVVSPHYDPMLAKVIAHGADREQARTRLVAALRNARVTGVVTNLAHLADVLDHPAFAAGDVTTSFLDDHLPDWAPPDLGDHELVAVAATLAATADRADPTPDPWTVLGPWRLAGGGGWTLDLAGATWRVATDPEGWRVRRTDADGDQPPTIVGRVNGPAADGTLVVEVDGVDRRITADRDGDHAWVTIPGRGSLRVAAPRRVRHLAEAAVAGAATLGSPMPGQVVDVPVAVDDHVAAGDVLVVVEAMKMEHPVTAPGPGTVTAIEVTVGDAVAADQVLVGFEVDEEDPDAS
nr:biotin carboxylase N-terminal domain-containing protein [Salsipaludibacter albus]